ncbi:FAD-binding protein [Paenarthrobacter sp. CAP02]|uniref:FAD-binding protein n=1 Tax=Paenarthrobacter sp. CAP02 TaxID=3158144 RepID=UPI0032DA5251
MDFVNRTGVRVDPQKSRARAEGGTTWADFNHATHAFGLATTGGIVGSTGVAGLTLGGGIGYLDRKYGLSCDNPCLGRCRDGKRQVPDRQRGTE